jgi:hypothetical protein
MTGEGLPTLHFDQLNVIAHHLHHISTGEDLWPNKGERPPIDDASITLAIMKALAIPKITCQKAMQSTSWPKFRKSEWKQLSTYDKQTMHHADNAQQTLTRSSYHGFGPIYTR